MYVLHLESIMSFYRPLFVLLFFVCRPLYCLSFCSLSVYHYIVCLFVLCLSTIILFVFLFFVCRPLYCLSFCSLSVGHYSAPKFGTWRWTLPGRIHGGVHMRNCGVSSSIQSRCKAVGAEIHSSLVKRQLKNIQDRNDYHMTP